jgi:hypothetical protein
MARKRCRDTDYTRTPRPCCTVYTIESVAKETDIDSLCDDMDALKSAIDHLRGVGGAQIIQKDLIAEDFETACDILDNRQVKV